MDRIAIEGTDLRVSPLCYGTASFGSGVRGEELTALIDAFRDAGGNFFDTAHCYAFWTPWGDGCSERSLADYFRTHGGRGEVVIATKGGHPFRSGYRKVDHYLSPGRVAADIDDSLGRLDCDAIDLYWLHRDDLRMGVGEIIDMLNAEITRGRIRYLGASNWTSKRIEQANTYARRHGLRGFVARQPNWSLAHATADEPDTSGTGDVIRYFGDDDIAWHRASRLLVTPFSSTARGYFAAERPSGSVRDAYDNPVSQERRARVRQLAAELGRTPTQVALAWLRGQEFPVIPIIGTTKRDHLRDALGAADLRLTAEQVGWLAGTD